MKFAESGRVSQEFVNPLQKLRAREAESGESHEAPPTPLRRPNQRRPDRICDVAGRRPSRLRGEAPSDFDGPGDAWSPSVCYSRRSSRASCSRSARSPSVEAPVHHIDFPAKARSIASKASRASPRSYCGRDSPSDGRRPRARAPRAEEERKGVPDFSLARDPDSTRARNRDRRPDDRISSRS